MGRPAPSSGPKRAPPCRAPLTDRLCELAKRHKLWLVPGSLFEVDGDKTYNTAVAINPEGQIVSRYRKIFPWYPFEAQATPGDEYCVFDVPEVGRFGLSIEPGNAALKARLGEAEALRAEGRATLPTRVDIELETNVFLRANEPAVREGVNMLVAPDWKVFAEVRERKNRA